MCVFHTRLLSLGSMFKRFSHVFECMGSLFFFIAE